MKKFLTIVLCLLLTIAMLTAPVSAVSYPDVDENASYAEAVEYLKDIGIMQGDEKGNFNPNQSVTRAEMAAIICRMLDETENLTTSNDFMDVPVTHWANKYVAKAAELGIVNGYGNGNFGPDDMVTFEQVVTMVIRAIGGADEAQKNGGYPNGFLFVANQYNFLDSVHASIGGPFSRAGVAIIIYNSIGFSFEMAGSDYNTGDQID